MINWHLNYKGAKCIEMQNGSVYIQERQEFYHDPLMLANKQKQDLDHEPVVLVIEDPLFGTTAFSFDNPGFEVIHRVNSHSSIKIQQFGESVQAGEDFNILSDGHIQVVPITVHTVFMTP